MEIKKFKPGDIVQVTRRGPIGWEGRYDFTGPAWANLYEGVDYRIDRSYTIEEAKEPSVSITEDRLAYCIHPNHFTLKSELP